MTNSIPIVISVLALALSGLTAWLTILRRGVVKATQPAVIFFGPDGGRAEGDSQPKVFLRCLLYSTGRRGNVVENMYVRLKRGESAQNFNIWVYGDSELTRGSGLFVGSEGISTNHHFLLPADGTSFEFLPGDYILELYCSLVGQSQSRQLCSIDLSVRQDDANGIGNGDCGLYFDWGPDSKRYHPHVQKTPPPIPREIAKLLRLGAA